jgi:hypothetical protein
MKPQRTPDADVAYNNLIAAYKALESEVAAQASAREARAVVKLATDWSSLNAHLKAIRHAREAFVAAQGGES